MSTLQQYLSQDCRRGIIDHDLRANVDDAGKVTFYIHPRGVDGETLDFVVHGNMLLAKDGSGPQSRWPGGLRHFAFFLIAVGTSTAAAVGWGGWKIGCVLVAVWAAIGEGAMEGEAKRQKQS